ncbi:hypothetical protein RHMOL_Rhmol10G0300000 [Rhododendron molle]|uniref:Uncharacterized protein n=1 Tax=Rhododendron molle TaxID=49168 RepID=A0ACC0M8Q3_RHOML|nr:hypothetical protein RHMOL_Rhmol10G0300000 [Rhododendron molle]
MGEELGYGFDNRFYHKLNGQFFLMQTDKEIMNLAYVVDARRVVYIYMKNAIVVGTQVSQICSNTLSSTIGKDVVIEDDYSDEYDHDSSSSEDDSDVVFNDSDYNLTDDDNEFEANVDKDIEFVRLSDKAEIDQSYAETIHKLVNINGDCDGGSFSDKGGPSGTKSRIKLHVRRQIKVVEKRPAQVVEISSPVEVQTVDVQGAKELITSGHRYLDVRTEEEFNKGHVDVEDALNIPYMFNTPQGRVKNPKFMEQVLSVCNKEDHLVVDFKHVRNMGGGYVAWVENGFAVKKPEH